MTEQQGEERLTGGNVTSVYRSGDTVRRERKSGSARIQQLLNHLEEKGYSYAPKFLGMDEQGREVLSYIWGEAGNYPLKKYMLSDNVLADIANMLRHYHETVSDFPFSDEWESLDGTPDQREVVCHNDFAVYNIIFNDEKPVGIIDFDVAAPGPKIWDVAYTLYTCVPLSRFSYTEAGKMIADDERIKQRIELFFNAYHLEKLDKDLMKLVVLRLQALCETMTRKASEGDRAFQGMIKEGHLDHYQKDIAFIQTYGHAWV
ncbi:phosphotransferase [Halobacillus kuroshimensis]|uniref:phosphotransferase n=1 Tax=Halobacillus kuroshimensis TaxID=302481 RepID=UPI00040F1492|nr:phosphotransferase [Halobacillus kuroshimensis]